MILPWIVILGMILWLLSYAIFKFSNKLFLVGMKVGGFLWIIAIIIELIK